jgi:hypothetical protein
MDLVAKLQLKPGQQLAVIGAPASVEQSLGDRAKADAGAGDAVLVFVRMAADLDGATSAVDAALADGLAWVAYPKGGALGTDLNRDTLAAQLRERGIQPVRQVAIDETWSALRFRPA